MRERNNEMMTFVIILPTFHMLIATKKNRKKTVYTFTDLICKQ